MAIYDYGVGGNEVKVDANVGKFLQHDSITMSFWYESSFNKHRIDHINLSVHVR